MRRIAAGILGVGAVLVAGACGNKGGDDAKPATTAAQTAAPAKTTAATATAAQTATATAAPPAAPAIPAGRTPAPTLAEWNGQKKEVTVKGSSALKCETKIVREYLRISCRGKVDPEGTPRGIKILKGGRGEALTFQGGDVMSLILPYVEGTDFEALFSWSQKAHKLAVKWPKGSKQPTIVGVFEGAASPLDGTAKGDNKKLCECHKKVTKSATCEDVFGAADADCDRTYGDNCQALLECSRGEPGRMPRCLPGFVNWGAMGRCYKLCGPTNPCPGDMLCNQDNGVGMCMD
jgi:hypothetical protein